ncbi:hypothetical protein PCC9214_01890 [Planktothrix tepida]|uniref:DUF3288 domain-containing protein n=3 Tax=Microcoleaceae TaxID=1892252 RepID=A0A1J1LKZ7_9CYAN|nr:hypothetical protein PCC9214_01890 [Planktothrix tepida]CAD5970988.1 hypothetical protein NO713_03820 [Planktothrix pseudagardhii]CUR33151.1 conserved hypothetical protein [Planktothrix tepida PCC 9214]
MSKDGVIIKRINRVIKIRLALSIMTTQEQKHPQYNTDRKIVSSFLEQEATDYNLAELARLKIRYRGFPGARDIQDDLEKILQIWGYTDESLFEKTRQIHATGQIYRGKKSDQEDWI